MASPLSLICCCSLVALLWMATTCYGDDPVGIVDRALECFSNHYVYSSCQESYRLNAEGHINVPVGDADQYCGGPCLVETRLVLNCIDSILSNFKFYNGASIQDVRYTLHTGCGYGNKRGDFNVFENLGEGDYNGNGGKLDAPLKLTILLGSVLLLLWG